MECVLMIFNYKIISKLHFNPFSMDILELSYLRSGLPVGIQTRGCETFGLSKGGQNILELQKGDACSFFVGVTQFRGFWAHFQGHKTF